MLGAAAGAAGPGDGAAGAAGFGVALGVAAGPGMGGSWMVGGVVGPGVEGGVFCSNKPGEPESFSGAAIANGTPMQVIIETTIP